MFITYNEYSEDTEAYQKDRNGGEEIPINILRGIYEEIEGKELGQ